MYTEIPWVLVSSGTQVQPQIILDPDYLLDYPFLMTIENINSNKCGMRRSYVIAQQYFKKFCKNYVVFERYDSFG